MNISLIVPCYNEEANIKKGVIDRIGSYTAHDERFCEIVIIDDGSTDQSKHILTSTYLSRYPKIRIVNSVHAGKAGAWIRGISEARGSHLLFTDMDLATPIEECEKLIGSFTPDTHIVIGSRSPDREGAPLSRKVMAYGMILIRRMLIGLRGIHDTQCGFKMFERNAARKIVGHLVCFRKRKSVTGSSVSAGFDLEFLFVAQRLGYKIKEIRVMWQHVETKRVTFIDSSLEAMKDILLIKWYDLTKQYPL